MDDVMSTSEDSNSYNEEAFAMILIMNAITEGTSTMLKAFKKLEKKVETIQREKFR